MYNRSLPSKGDLPTAAGLVRSTLIAALTATLIVTTVVLPAEYGVDPTGLGDVLGYTEMGQIKTQLAEEALADRIQDDKVQFAAQVAAVEAAAGHTDNVGASAEVDRAQNSRTDQMKFALKPGEGAEVKLQMKRGAKATYVWSADGGRVNSDLHGEGVSQMVSYAKQRGVASDEGTITAKFDGDHGWYWRNRSDGPVIIVVKATGDYAVMKRML